MNIIIVGLNHKSAPVEIREKLSFTPDGLGAAFENILTDRGISEAVINSTCNRVEVVIVAPDQDKGELEIKKYLADYSGFKLEELDLHLYSHRGEDAVKHLFKVAAGLDSMVMGEPQILGQVKDAYTYANDHKAAGIIIRKLFHKTFSVAKKIRTETKIGESAVSISFAAVELAKKIFSSIEDKSVMLIGAGEMAELAAKHFKNSGIENIMVANRTYEKAVELSNTFNGRPIMFREFTHYLKDVDIVLASTGAQKFIIHEEDVKRVMKDRKQSPMFFIDISVPRNIDPLVNNIANAYVYDVDDLQGVVSSNMGEREKEAQYALEIIEEEIPKFYRWVKSLDVVPTIRAMQNGFEEIRKAELDKFLNSLGDKLPEKLTEKEAKSLDMMTRAIVKKILHNPMSHLRKQSDSVDGDFYIEAARKLFDIKDTDLAVENNAEEDQKKTGG